MKTLLTLFYVAMMLNVYSLEILEYNEVLVRTFAIGRGYDELYYEEHIAGMDRHGPTAIAFDEEGYLYICDSWNFRINRYNADFNYEYTIKYNSPNMLNGADQLFVYDNMLYGIGRSSSAMLGDFNGNIYFSIKFLNLPIQYSRISKDNHINYNRYFFFYNTNGNINCVPPPEDYATSWGAWKVLNNNQTRALFDAEIPELAGLTIDDKNRLYMNGKLYSRNYSLFHEHYSSLYSGWEHDNRHIIIPIPKSISESVYYIGSDRSGNTYWDLGGLVRVFSAEGWVKHIFSYSVDNLSMLPAIHPSGDLYFLKYDPEGMYLYKIERQW